MCSRRPATVAAAGFTLLELLVTVSILAALAVIATGTYRGVLEDSDKRLVRTEMQSIAAAIRKFKQDTGYYPKEGPFNMGSDGKVTDTELQAVTHSGSSAQFRSRWFESPANFYQLLQGPLLPDAHPLSAWDPETRRGWNGPYIAGFKEGYVDIGNDMNESENGADGDPLVGNPLSGMPSDEGVAQDVDGLADPFEHKPEEGLLNWSREPRPDRVELDSWGRPYLYLKVDDKWSLVSMGPNGDYESGATGPGGDDILLRIE